MLISVTQNNKPVSRFTPRQVELGRTQQVMGWTSPHRATKRQKGKCVKEQTIQKEKSQNMSFKQNAFYLHRACLALLQKAEFYCNLQYYSLLVRLWRCAAVAMCCICLRESQYNWTEMRRSISDKNESCVVSDLSKWIRWKMAGILWATGENAQSP